MSPHPYTANTTHTSFISPAFLHSQPPTASLFFHQILCSVSSLTSQVSNSSHSLPHQTFQRLLIQWKMTSSGLFPCKYFSLFSHCNHYCCFQPAASIPSGGCHDFLLSLFSPLLCTTYLLKPSLPKEHLVLFQRAASPGQMPTLCLKEHLACCGHKQTRNCRSDTLTAARLTQSSNGEAALGWAIESELKNAGS